MKNFIDIIDDENEKKQIVGFYNQKIFSFTYNSIRDINFNPNYDSNKFQNS